MEFEEFLAMMTRRLASTATDDAEARRQRHDAELRQAFRVFDIDGDGLIDADELRQTMANLGETLSDHDVHAMIREADRNGDGKVDFDGNVHARAQGRAVLATPNRSPRGQKGHPGGQRSHPRRRCGVQALGNIVSKTGEISQLD